mmetsp:Transcript_23520/g.39412  ORF Transcript_23520/g.39412 Transcript_23520/m.39412 type:complete len:326 (+) Transcript_23520:170-1147(+)
MKEMRLPDLNWLVGFIWLQLLLVMLHKFILYETATCPETNELFEGQEYFAGHKRKPSIAVFIAYNNRPNIANWTAENKRLYAQMHGYTFVHDPPEAISNDRPPAWHKIGGTQRILHQFDWVCWFDLDTVITDMNRRIEDVVNPRYDFAVARTWELFDVGEETHRYEFRINTGVFCIRNTTWSHWFLQKVWDKTDYITHSNWEQRAMQVILREEATLWPHIQILDQHEFNCHILFWHVDDFVLHYSGGMMGCPTQFNGCENHHIYMCKWAKHRAGLEASLEPYPAKEGDPPYEDVGDALRKASAINVWWPLLPVYPKPTPLNQNPT